jgi:hypothetical protein
MNSLRNSAGRLVSCHTSKSSGPVIIGPSPRCFRRAVRSGKVRVDASPVELAVLSIANAGLIHRTVDDAPRSSARLVALWLAGVISHANVEAPPAPTESEIRRALNNCGAAQQRTAASGSLSPLARQGPSSSNDHENRCR